MRLLHEVIDDLHHHAEERAIALLGHVLVEPLGGERGTLHALADRFTQAGLGPIVASWIGHGPDLPIHPDERRHVPGEARTQDMATLAGMSSVASLERLCRLLPPTMHAITPGGRARGPIGFLTIRSRRRS
jgi:uncharacterized protein YidB (DUF937 family)